MRWGRVLLLLLSGGGVLCDVCVLYCIAALANSRGELSLSSEEFIFCSVVV